jgi:hypothetical protein
MSGALRADRYYPARRGRHDILLWFVGDPESPFFLPIASGASESSPAVVAYTNRQ